MSVYKIVNFLGEVIDNVEAANERQALCVYLMNHEEMVDAMLWRCVSGGWKLAEYDSEEEFIFARKA